MSCRWLTCLLIAGVVVGGTIGARADEIWFQTFTEGQIAEMAAKQVVISTDHGEILLRFFPEVAPNHVHSFLSLVRMGFYNGTIFHRVGPLFIQGGDPNTRNSDRSVHGFGGPGYYLQNEFNAKSHTAGALSAARSMLSTDSAGSQFFICARDWTALDGAYTVFGEVVSGLDVVRAIAAAPVPTPPPSDPDNPDLNPVERIEITAAILPDVDGDAAVGLPEAIHALRGLVGGG